MNPLRGYAYDSFNKDALLRLAKVEDGRMTLPGGVSYKVLVVPLPRPMNPEQAELSPEVEKKINELKKAGILFLTFLIPEMTSRHTDWNVI